MGHYMTNDTTTVQQTGTTGLDNMDAHREINRIAEAIIDRRVATEAQLVAECYDVAHEHYVTIEEVYKKVWAKVAQSNELHATHPAGKTVAYHTLRERAERAATASNS